MRASTSISALLAAVAAAQPIGVPSASFNGVNGVFDPALLQLLGQQGVNFGQFDPQLLMLLAQQGLNGVFDVNQLNLAVQQCFVQASPLILGAFQFDQNNVFGQNFNQFFGGKGFKDVFGKDFKDIFGGKNFNDVFGKDFNQLFNLNQLNGIFGNLGVGLGVFGQGIAVNNAFFGPGGFDFNQLNAFGNQGLDQLVQQASLVFLQCIGPVIQQVQFAGLNQIGFNGNFVNGVNAFDPNLVNNNNIDQNVDNVDDVNADVVEDVAADEVDANADPVGDDVANAAVDAAAAEQAAADEAGIALGEDSQAA